LFLELEFSQLLCDHI
jgi:hypothetical protein